MLVLFDLFDHICHLFHSFLASAAGTVSLNGHSVESVVPTC